MPDSMPPGSFFIMSAAHFDGLAYCLSGLAFLMRSQFAQTTSHWSPHTREVAKSTLDFVDAHATDEHGNLFEAKTAKYIKDKAID